MKYHKANWKYKLEETEDYQFPEPLEDEFTHHLLALDPKNELCGGGFGIVHGSGLFCVCKTRVVVRNGYAWDGPSGPTIDTENSMRASLVHDVLYQGMREGMLPAGFRERADSEFSRILKEDGMWWPRRWLWWLGVRLLGGGHARPPSG